MMAHHGTHHEEHEEEEGGGSAPGKVAQAFLPSRTGRANRPGEPQRCPLSFRLEAAKYLGARLSPRPPVVNITPFYMCSGGSGSVPTVFRRFSHSFLATGVRGEGGWRRQMNQMAAPKGQDIPAQGNALGSGI